MIREGDRPTPARSGQLVLFTSSYPFSHAAEDSFIRPELEALGRKFSRVLLVPAHTGYARDSLPSDFEVDVSLADALTPGLRNGLAALWHLPRQREVYAEAYLYRSRLFHLGTAQRFVLYSAAAEATRRWVQRARSDGRIAVDAILYTYWYNAVTVGLAWAKTKQAQFKLISRAHGSDLYEERSAHSYIPYRQSSIASLDKIFAISEHGANYLIDRYPAHSARIRLSRLGVPAAPAQSPIPNEPNVITIVSCSHILPIKRVDLILRVVAEYARSAPDARVHWHHFGSGPLQKSVAKLAGQIAPANLKWILHGHTANKDVLAAYLNIPVDVFINLSLGEGAPVAIMEAISFGIPVLATDVGGTKELLTLEVGSIIPVDAEVPKIVNTLVETIKRGRLVSTRSSAVDSWRKLADSERNHAHFAQELADSPGEEVRSMPDNSRSWKNAAANKMCSRCVMDSSDPSITFDAQGVCSNCHAFISRWESRGRHLEGNQDALASVVQEMRRARGKARYDCVIGVSGGVDSTWVAHLVTRLGLRALAVHLDNGWNSDIAVSNIANCLKRLKIDLLTVVPDWEEFRDIQVAFLRSSIPNVEIPTDHAILSALFQTASEQGVKYVIGGDNLATEGVMPASWMYDARDLRLLTSVHRRFGTRRLTTVPRSSLVRFGYYALIRQIKYLRILDLVDYDKASAKEQIKSELGWLDYGGKHYESRFTRFFQSYILPVKFGFDKRRAHLSSLILSGQLTREQALGELKLPLWDDREIESDIEFVCKKLRLSREQFNQILSEPPQLHSAFASNRWLFERGAIRRRLGNLMLPRSLKTQGRQRNEIVPR